MQLLIFVWCMSISAKFGSAATVFQGISPWRIEFDCRTLLRRHCDSRCGANARRFWRAKRAAGEGPGSSNACDGCFERHGHQTHGLALGIGYIYVCSGSSGRQKSSRRAAAKWVKRDLVAADIICQWLRIMGRRTRWGSAPRGQNSRHLNRCWSARCMRQIASANSGANQWSLKLARRRCSLRQRRINYPLRKNVFAAALVKFAPRTSDKACLGPNSDLLFARLPRGRMHTLACGISPFFFARAFGDERRIYERSPATHKIMQRHRH